MSEEKKYYELDLDGFEDIPKYDGPDLMTDEYCASPHFLGSYEEGVAWKHAMAARCIEENREVVFVRNLPFVDNVDKNGNVQEHVAWDSPVGDTIRFTCEARNPKTGEWEEKIFNISTAERSAMIDGHLVLEGTKVDGTKYTISEHDFSKELDIERDIRGLPPISQEAEQKEIIIPEGPTVEPFTKEDVLAMSLGLNSEELTAGDLEDMEREAGLPDADYNDGPTVGIFKGNDGSDMEPYYNDPEYGPSY